MKREARPITEPHRFDDIVDAATDAIRADAELRLDIAHELRAHLDDTYDALRREGENDAEALEGAKRAFGDPAEVAKEILRANLKRMRLRAVIKWAFRLTLLPATAVVVLLLIGYLLVSGSADMARLALTGTGEAFGGFAQEGPVRFLGDYLDKQALRDDWSEEERALWETKSTEMGEMVERYPERPDYFALHMLWEIDRHRPWESAPDSLSWEEATALLDRGETLDPDNALYDYVRAWMLFRQAGAEVDDDESLSLPRPEPMSAWSPYTLSYENRELVERAVEVFRAAAGKPDYDSYAFDVGLRRLNLRRTPKSFREELRKLSIVAGLLLPDLAIIRGSARSVCAYAWQLAREGRKPEALELLDAVQATAVKQGANSDMLIELLGAAAIEEMALGTEAAIRGLEGDRLRESDWWTHSEQMYAARNDEARMFRPADLRDRGTLLVNLLAPSGLRRNMELLRRWRMLDRVLLERAAFTAALHVGLLIVVPFILLSLYYHVAGRNVEERGAYFFPPTARDVAALLLAAAVPVALYWLYTHLVPGTTVDYNIAYAPVRNLMEFIAAGVVTFGGAILLVRALLRRRLRRKGLDVPARGLMERNVFMAGAVFMLIVAVIFAFNWQGEGWRKGAPGRIALGLFCLPPLLWLLLARLRLQTRFGEHPVYFRTMQRSFVPYFLVFLLLFAVGGHLLLDRAEARAVAAFQEPGYRLNIDEIDMTLYSDLRDAFAERHEAMMHSLHTSPRGAAESDRPPG
jgi:hypothetical protein